MKRESLLAITINYIILALLLATFGDSGGAIVLSVFISALVSVCIADYSMNMIVDYRDGLFDLDD